MNPAAEQAQGNERRPARRRARGVGVRFRIGTRRKGYWKSSSATPSTSSGASCDDSENFTQTHQPCERPLTEVHLCSDTEGFSDTTSGYATTDTEHVQAEAILQKKKRKRRTFLSHQFKRKPKKIGCLRIDDGVEDNSDDENEHNEEDDADDHESNYSETGSESEQKSDGEISIPDDLSLADISDIENYGKHLNDDAAGFSNQPEPEVPMEIALDSAEVEPEPEVPMEIALDSAQPNSEFPMHGTSDLAKIDAGGSDSQPQPKVLKDGATDSAKIDDKVPPIPNVSLKYIMNKLTLLLPSDWGVDIVESSVLRIINLDKSKNPSVQASVFYDLENCSVGLFVHGIPVSRENKVFQSSSVPDSENLGSVADYLSGLVQRVLLSKQCCGLKNYDANLWSTSSSVFKDYSSSLESPCYRHVQCPLLIPGGSKRDVCSDCQNSSQKFERELKKREEGQLDPSTIPDKYLTKEGMKAKKNKYRMLLKAEKQKADRLEKRLDSALIKLDEVLKDDLSSILRANQHKMTPLQKIFWKDQLKVLALDDNRGMRWHPMLIRLALHLHSLSDAAYEFVNDSKIFTLPSSRRLFDYSHFIEAAEGCQPELIKYIKEKIRNCGEADHYNYINLMFDEMHIRSGLVFSRSTGELVGYTKLTGVEEELSKIQSELNSKTFKPRLAKKVLVYMAQGITSDVKDVVAVYSTDDLSASQLFDRTWDVIYHLEEAEIKVLSLTCDGASINRKFIGMHKSLDQSSNYCYVTKNLASGDSRPLFFVLDPPHLLKTLRNALANSFSHKKSRKLWKNNQFMSWKVIEILYEATKNQKFRAHKLTKAHVKLTSFSCMTVLYATQTFSYSVARCIEDMANHDVFKLLHTSELVKFIRLTNRFFDCVNGKDDGAEKKNADKAAFTDPNDARFDFLEKDFLGYFEEWKRDVINRPGIYTDAERSRMIVSHQALGALEITVKGVAGAIRYMLTEAKAPSVSARMFNQDPLEQYFSKIRRKQGDNRNPLLDGFLHTRLNIHAQGHVSLPSKKGNTEVEKRKDIEVDSTALPSRKVQRKSKD